MSSPLLVKISQDGKEIVEYSVQEAVRLLTDGTLRTTDHYWHDGMTEWAPLVKLQASEARRELAERAVQLKQEEANRAIAEAVWARHKSEKENRFRCHSCQNVFVYPKKQGGIFWRGIAFILLSGLAFFITYSVADIHRPSPSGFFSAAYCLMTLNHSLSAVFVNILVLEALFFYSLVLFSL
jgi:hypothetical protein